MILKGNGHRGLANQSQILYEASIGKGNPVYINNLGHMTKMATMPIYNPIKNLLQNWKSHFYETWHEALMTEVLHRVFAFLR